MTAVTESPVGRKLVRPRKSLGQDVYSLALERMAEIMGRFDHIAVSFSGGKDSTATLNVALEVAHSAPQFRKHLPIRAVFFDEEAIPYETEEYVRRMGERDDVNLEWYCLPVQHRNACSRRSPYWWPWAPEAKDLWCRPLPPEAITAVPGFRVYPAEARYTIPDTNGLLCPPRLGNCAQLMGIRAAESLTRNLAVSQRAVDNYIIPYTGATSRGNIWKVYPVYDWTDTDVWTAPALKGWDYNRAYDRQAMAGVGVSRQRCSPAFGEEPIQKLHLFAQCFPEVWEKMVDRVPGVGSAVRYALTELYGFGKIPDKPDGLTWPQFAHHFLAKHEPAARKMIAARIAQTIRGHYNATSLPIAPTAHNPVTGLDWKFLVAIAMRGDFKGRRKPTYQVDMNPDGTRPARTWIRYAEELAEVIAQGRVAELGHPGPFPADPWALVPEYAREEIPA